MGSFYSSRSDAAAVVTQRALGAMHFTSSPTASIFFLSFFASYVRVPISPQKTSSSVRPVGWGEAFPTVPPLPLPGCAQHHRKD